MLSSSIDPDGGDGFVGATWQFYCYRGYDGKNVVPLAAETLQENQIDYASMEGMYVMWG